jgi:hypothetical protein
MVILTIVKGGVLKMADRNREFKTGERVSEAGRYACKSGERRDLNANDSFPVCPVSGGETTWSRE